LRIAVPDELVELYSWRNGHLLEFDPELHATCAFEMAPSFLQSGS
jgi:hypothetical protein